MGVMRAAAIEQPAQEADGEVGFAHWGGWLVFRGLFMCGDPLP